MGDSYNRATKTEKRKHVLTDLNRTLAQSGPDDELTDEEFNEALRGRGKDTEPGPDKIRYSDIKKLYKTEEDRTELHTIYQESFDNGCVPEEWTDSILRPISKRGKAHYKLNACRILTMQNTVGKLMEGTVARKLARDLEDTEILPENRGWGGGVRPGKCSWKIAAAFVYDVYEGVQRKEQAVAVATDLEDACNRVQFKLLMDLHIPWESA